MALPIASRILYIHCMQDAIKLETAILLLLPPSLSSMMETQRKLSPEQSTYIIILQSPVLIHTE